MRVVPLSEVKIGSAAELFEEEIQCWRNQLFWDYQPAVSLISKYIESRTLPGYALITATGRVVGYSYYAVSYPIGYVGNVYVRRKSASASSYGQLLDPTVSSLRSGGRVQRIECQAFSFNCDLAPLFTQLGFEALERHFLYRDLTNGKELSQQRDLASAFRVVSWESRYLEPAAQVVFDSYQTSADYRICRDYQSQQGCLRFLRNLVDSPGCGTFLPETSYLALDSSGLACAVLITSKIGPETGMIPQISVRRDSQGKGIGSQLLGTYFQNAYRLGLRRVALSVTNSNKGAHQLYSRLGFSTAKDFHAFIWNA